MFMKNKIKNSNLSLKTKFVILKNLKKKIGKRYKVLRNAIPQEQEHLKKFMKFIICKMYYNIVLVSDKLFVLNTYL